MDPPQWIGGLNADDGLAVEDKKRCNKEHRTAPEKRKADVPLLKYSKQWQQFSLISFFYFCI